MNDFPEFRKLTEENCKLRMVSTRHLPELKQEIENRQDEGQFDAEFAQQCLHRFRFTLPEELRNAESIIVVAMPRPPTKAIFNWNGKKYSFILPPTYTGYDEKRLHVERLVAEVLRQKGYKIAAPLLPLKLLAARSGLVEYGRNNITYVKGMGSFMQLAAVYSDVPCEKDEWQEPQTMKRCEKCDLCSKACPTGAISADRFLLRAEKCITYHNEKRGDVPFPEWIKKSWHNCLIGCMRCQYVCPENQRFLQWVGETAEFDELETKMLLKGTPREQLPSSTMNKLKSLSLTDYFDELSRNLSAMLK